MNISTWVRTKYRVADPTPSQYLSFPLGRIVRAYDWETNELVGEWEEGGYLPDNLLKEFLHEDT